MRCEDIEDIFESYALGALSAAERAGVEAHLAGCDGEHPRLAEAVETMGLVAASARRVPAPGRVAEALRARVDGELGRRPDRTAGRARPRWWTPWAGGLAHPATALAALSIAVLIAGGVWLDGRLDSVERGSAGMARVDEMLAEVMAEQAELSGRVGDMDALDSEVMDMVRDQRTLTFMAANPDGTVHMLRAGGAARGAHGMAVASADGRSLMLAAADLPALPAGLEYRVWLGGGAGPMDGGVLDVDSTGFGQALIRSPEPMWEYDSVAVTVEPVGGKGGPTGEPALMGEL